MNLFFSICLVLLSSISFAKEATRFPASEAVVSVEAPNLKEGLRKIAKDPKVAAIIRAQRAEYKKCDGTLGRFDDKAAMMFYSGKGSVATHFTGYLVPMYGGCAGTGMIEEARLVAKIGVNINMENEDSEKYSFYGFIKTTTLGIGEKDQTSGLSDW